MFLVNSFHQRIKKKNLKEEYCVFQKPLSCHSFMFVLLKTIKNTFMKIKFLKIAVIV